MTIAIIGAMDEEVHYLRKMLNKVKEKTIANVTFYEGQLEQHPIVLLKSGIGKTNAAMATTILMEHYQPAYVINTGSAGGLQDTSEVGDLIIADEVVYHDVDVTAFQYAYGQVPQLPKTFQSDRTLLDRVKQALEALNVRYSIGLVGTADTFMADASRVAFVKDKFPMIHAAEMEAAAIAQVCYLYKVPFIVIRALSDIAGGDAAHSFDEFIKTASKNASQMIQHMLKNES